LAPACLQACSEQGERIKALHVAHGPSGPSGWPIQAFDIRFKAGSSWQTPASSPSTAMRDGVKSQDACSSIASSHAKRCIRHMPPSLAVGNRSSTGCTSIHTTARFALAADACITTRRPIGSQRLLRTRTPCAEVCCSPRGRSSTKQGYSCHRLLGPQHQHSMSISPLTRCRIPRRPLAVGLYLF
jgi:hypothetical protein